MTGDPHAENRRLRTELARLREEHEYLKCFLDVATTDGFIESVSEEYGITKQQAAFLQILHNANGRCVHRDLIMAALPGREREKDARYKLDHVIVCKIRSKIGAEKIVTHHAEGYSLTKSFIEELNEMVSNGRQSLRDGSGRPCCPPEASDIVRAINGRPEAS